MQRTARAERYTDKSESQIVNPVKVQKLVLTRFDNQVKNLLRTLAEAPNKTSLRHIDQVQLQIEDTLLGIEAAQHAL